MIFNSLYGFLKFYKVSAHQVCALSVLGGGGGGGGQFKKSLCTSALVSEQVYNFCFSTPLDYSLFEPRHEISNNVVCATSNGLDQPAHMRSLIRAFASPLNIL